MPDAKRVFLNLLVVIAIMMYGQSAIPYCSISTVDSLPVIGGLPIPYQTCDLCVQNYNIYSSSYLTAPDGTGTGVQIFLCNICDPNCRSCTANPLKCLTCNPGLYLDSGDVCSECANQHLNCLQCDLMICTKCKPAYTPSSLGVCQFACQNRHGAECSDCDENLCFSCNQFFALNQNKPPFCVPCSDIANCYNCTNGPVCTQCIPDTYHNNSDPTKLCFVCSDILNCVSCKQGPQCTLCDAGFVLTDFVPDNGCVPCPSGFYAQFPAQCSSCPGTNCDTCGDVGNGLECQLCVLPYTLDTNKACVINCQTVYSSSCSTCDSTKCLSCVTGYALDGSNVCTDCTSITGCQNCANGPVCTQCLPGLYFDNSLATKECYPCPLNCVSCVHGVQCTQCAANYVLSAQAPGNICNSCPGGNYVSSPTTCTPCPVGCATCSLISGSVKCQSCTASYTLSNSQCLINCTASYGTGCSTCDGSVCLSCLTGYAFPAGSTTCTACTTITDCVNCNNGLVCTQCVDNRYLNYADASRACVPCSYINNCGSCNHGPVCLQCSTTNYVLTAIGLGNDCIPCPTGEYASSLLGCTPCPTGCATCSLVSGVVQCQTCDTFYTLSTSKLCVIDCVASHGATCATCTLTTCLSCVLGYAFPAATPTTCAPCSNIINCLTCTNGLKCTSCSNNLWVDVLTLNGTCTSCSVIPNCVKCKNGPQCISCAINYVVNATVRMNSCVTCPAGTYASSSMKCSTCPPECAVCSNSASGLVCSSCTSIAIHDATIQQCRRCDLLIDHCKQCSTPLVCGSCLYPYKLGSTLICNQCQSGFFYNDGFCSKQAGCQIYLFNESRCLSCFMKKNFYLDITTKKCKCKTGYYEHNTTIGLTTCVSRCGDGILVTSDEFCDDGNIRNGDGCSQTCQQQTDFVCFPLSPSHCLLQYTIGSLQYNYALKYDGQNKGRFSLSLLPYHPALKYVNWGKYLTFNVSDQIIVAGSKVFTYNEESSELTIDFQYKSTVEELTVEFKLVIDSEGIGISGFQPRLLVENTDEDNKYIQNFKPSHQFEHPSIHSSLNTNRLLISSQQMKLVIKLSGINSKLLYQQSSLLQLYKGATIGSYIITILILIQFVIGSYMHKMIGLQTIQILQFFFFVRIVIQQKLSTFMNSMNIFKYSAYGGYSNYQLVYGQQSKQVQTLTYMTVEDNFVIVDLLRYFTINTNMSLVIPLLALVGFLVTLVRKNLKRNQYLKYLEQSIKDQYTILRRSSQWVYDHFVFPYINIFNMIVVFSTFLYLQAHSAVSSSNKFSNPSLINLIEITSFSTQCSVAFVTFSIYCFEVFKSYEEFKYSGLTEAEKARVPKSIYEQLEHDENNPDRPNYKPGYILFYLVYYFMVEIFLMLDVLFQPLKGWGIEFMLGLSFSYFYFVWKWNPYNEAVDFHNKALRFNHFTVFFFMALCLISKWVALPVIAFAIMICFILALLTIVSLLGYIRIVIQYKFRKRLLEDPNLMNEKKKRQQIQVHSDEPVDKKKALLNHNRFAFDNQLKAWLKQNRNLNTQNYSKQQMENAKFQIKKELYEYKKLSRLAHGFDDMFDHYMVQKSQKKQPKEKENQMMKNIPNSGEAKKQQNYTQTKKLQKKAQSFRSSIKEQLQAAKIFNKQKRHK